MVRRGRWYGRVIAGLKVHTAGGTTLIICATISDMGIVQNEMIGAVQSILAWLGAPPQIVFTTRAGWEARSGGAGNARSRPAPTTGFAIDGVSRLGAPLRAWFEMDEAFGRAERSSSKVILVANLEPEPRCAFRVVFCLRTVLRAS
jgi:hypothetical protein